MVQPAIHLSSECMLTSEFMILDLLRAKKSLALEQVISLLPELSWNQIFTAVDELSRRGEIILLRRGFQYEVEWAPARKPTLSCVG
jgi:hypothetical protein